MAKPGPPGANLGQMLSEAVGLHRQGRLDDAERLYSRVLKVERHQFDALHLLGMLNHQRGKTGEAYRLLNAALKAQPRSTEALSNLALVLHALKRDDEALASLDKALALAPGSPDALNTRGIVFADLNRPTEALAAFDRLLAAQPGNPHALYNRGNALRMLGREVEALAAYDQALAAVPAHAGAWHNRGLALQGLNRHRDAIASYGRALALQPDYADAHFNEASAWLTLGDYHAGLPKYEWRWKRAGMGGERRFRQPLWLGETSLAGKTILLHAEQGLGDTIMFVRYATILARAGARVVIEVQPELKALLMSLDGAAANLEIVARGETLPAFDLHCPLASLPLACKTELATIPADIPYLRASEARIAKWRPRLEALSRPRIALAWSGRATHPNDRNRSLALSELAPLPAAMPGAGFIGIQRELRSADAEALARAPGIVALGEELADFADTAAVLALCDRVVCVDTSVAHVAAALGRPTSVLLPFQPDWRWLTDRDHSPWYPAVRLHRQPKPGDWAGAIAGLSEELASQHPPVT